MASIGLIVPVRVGAGRKSQIRLAAKSTLVAMALLGAAFASNANAAAQDEAVSELRSFVQTVATTDSHDASLAALEEFLRGAAPQLPGIKVAEATTLFDALRQWGQPDSPAPQAQAPVGARRAAVARAAANATLVDNSVCLTCHATQAAEFSKTLMGKIGQTRRGMFDCQNCHGPGSEHVRLGGGRGVGGILSFGPDDPRPVQEQNQICLNCHQKGERTYWAGSIHQTRDVACTNCHTVMKNVSRKHNLRTVAEMETCFQCHQLKRAQIQRSSHMPIREGKITCSDCHNPHGSATEKLIRQASVNDNCYSCHAEKRGPFLYEHIPVRENCLNCHNPHGSNYDNLLKVARPRLCNECHTTVHSPTLTGGFGNPNTAYTLQNACGNCHSNIHGSNHPNGFFFLR